MKRGFAIAVLIVAAYGAAPQGLAAARTASQSIDELWQDRDIPSLDMRWGASGPDNAPQRDATFLFKGLDATGFSGGYQVIGPDGRSWKVKTGLEGQPELVASRLLWAAGYYQPAMYYLINWKLHGGPVATPEAGRFRLESDHKSGQTWSWDQNPFRGTREFKGLVVLNVMLNNWDFKTSNNRIYRMRGKPSQRYVVQDLGASLGKRSWPAGSRNAIADFESQKFVLGVENGHVLFDHHGLHPELLKDITPADVVWICDRLNRLTDQQWDDLFAAAAYDQAVAARFMTKIKSKIAEGLALGPRPTSVR